MAAIFKTAIFAMFARDLLLTIFLSEKAWKNICKKLVSESPDEVHIGFFYISDHTSNLNGGLVIVEIRHG